MNSPGAARRRSGPKAKNVKGSLSRLLKLLFSYYKAELLVVAISIVISAFAGTITSMFMNRFVLCVEEGLVTGFDSVYGNLVKYVIIMGGIYLLGLVATFCFTRLMAIVTQGFLKKMREVMFNKMQNLPIKYFDTRTHGDIMSHYTNDIDTLRQLISHSLPQFITAAISIISLFCYMIYLSIWLTVIVIIEIIIMTFVVSKIGGNSAKFFIKQQKSLGKVEGYIEEMMHGQKVVKVFCHEEETIDRFKKINKDLFFDAKNANKFANILMPIMANIGNIVYVLLAIVGGTLIILRFPNFSLSGQLMSVAVVIPFLNMTRQFSMNISGVSQQINAIVMGLAGAERIFELMDQDPELDEGYVTLVNVMVDQDGQFIESKDYTGVWAWKHPHTDGTVSYIKLEGDVTFEDVDFGYSNDKQVLHNITLYAEPGQKIAFVGATGAGKTTITNLINRFYDISNGKLRYDGININKIKKDDLRHSLGIVLQDTNLFTGTVLENIRYGKLSATNEECIDAAKLANAHDFITRLPEGYNTMLVSDGANLSQGQRQLLSIARAAVANPPVMILDEATSSIDTRTETLVQKGMDGLMKGRTVFIIAHRLSTVQNSDVIMVMEKGKIIERGNHEKLIKEKGKYYQLYTGAFELD